MVLEKKADVKVHEQTFAFTLEEIQENYAIGAKRKGEK